MHTPLYKTYVYIYCYNPKSLHEWQYVFRATKGRVSYIIYFVLPVKDIKCGACWLLMLLLLLVYEYIYNILYKYDRTWFGISLFFSLFSFPHYSSDAMRYIIVLYIIILYVPIPLPMYNTIVWIGCIQIICLFVHRRDIDCGLDYVGRLYTKRA